MKYRVSESRSPRWARRAAAATLAALALFSPAPLAAQRDRDFTIPRPLPPESYLVIGFLGGIEHWNSQARPVRRLALDLRAKGLPNVYVETVEHAHRSRALRLIRDALDRNRDGQLDPREAAAARIILYGHSFGGEAVVKLARELKARHVPVLLTVQVDSVGRNRTIPANVRHAANLYQHSSHVIRGDAEIVPDDAQATTIVGNFQYDYGKRKVDLRDASVVERIGATGHTKMEFDPAVWSKVEELIVREIRR